MKKISLFLAMALCFVSLLGLHVTAATSEAETTLVIGNPTSEGTAYSGGYRIPGIVVTDNGTVLTYWEARYATGTDTGSTDIIVRRSTDGGTSFSDCLSVKGAEYTENGYGNTLTNPIMIAGENGRVHFLFACETGNAGVWYMYSDDNGANWSEAVNIVSALNKSEIGWSMCNLGPGHGICLKNGENAGRLVVPVWCYTGTYDVYTLYSDDNGATWEMGSRVGQNLDESCIVELSDGSVMVNSRQYGLPYDEANPNRTEEEAYRAVSISPTGIGGWSDTYFDTTLIDPACEGNICSTTINGKRALLFVNCASKTDRWDLTVRCSFDDGRSWVSKTVYLDRVGWYSDIAVDSDGTVYVIHEDSSVTNSGGKLCMELFTFNAAEAFGAYVNEVVAHFAEGTNAYQTKTTADGFCVRFVAELNCEPAYYSKAGFDVTVTYNGGILAENYKLESTCVYSQLQSGNDLITPTSGQYFVAQGISGVPTDGAVTFTVKPYAVTITGAVVYGEVSTVNFYNGAPTPIGVMGGDSSYIAWDQILPAA